MLSLRGTDRPLIIYGDEQAVKLHCDRAPAFSGIFFTNGIETNRRVNVENCTSLPMLHIHLENYRDL